MRILGFLFLSFFSLSSFAQILVQQGDTLYSLSRQHGISVSEIQALNHLSDSNLKIGQTLLIEKSISSPSFQEPKGITTVKQGETLSQISQRTGVSDTYLIRLNALTPPYALREGQMLKLKDNFPMPQYSANKTHIVQQGDTLFSISRKYAISVSEIKNRNQLTDNTLKIGQVLVLGESSTPSSPPQIKPPQILPYDTPVNFSAPLQGKIISSFGVKSNGLKNEGINIESAKGTPVSAIEKGIVVYLGNGMKGLGNVVILKHSQNYTSVYAHLDQTSVSYNDILNKGDVLGTVGLSGKVTSPQLHLEIRQKISPKNPLKLIDFQ
ncbi:MAG: LysM peptidoglycan-binding domain-containing M23 family metallopeptidase [Alphaproteobacteria bacterium]|nr:LysM peptidoglycan-binding domain-containing M23 family metallopeptidase [Alphaproteobacteria bacterium]